MNALEFLELLKSEPKVSFKVGDKVAVYLGDEGCFEFHILRATVGYMEVDYPLTYNQRETFTESGFELLNKPKPMARSLFHIEEVKPIGLQIPPEFLSRFPDKSPVLCWDNGLPQIRFWDAKNDCTFQLENGEREGFTFTNYKPLLVEHVKVLWGAENYQRAYDKLED